MVYFYWRIATFIFGVLLGIRLAKICVYGNYEHLNVPVKKHIPSYQTWSTGQGLKRKLVSWDILRYGNSNIYKIESNILITKIHVLHIVFGRNEKNFNGAKESCIGSCNNFDLELSVSAFNL